MLWNAVLREKLAPIGIGSSELYKNQTQSGKLIGKTLKNRSCNFEKNTFSLLKE